MLSPPWCVYFVEKTINLPMALSCSLFLMVEFIFQRICYRFDNGGMGHLVGVASENLQILNHRGCKIVCLFCISWLLYKQ